MIISAFAEMDEDEDGEITQEEFIKVKVGCKLNTHCNVGAFPFHGGILFLQVLFH